MTTSRIRIFGGAGAALFLALCICGMGLFSKAESQGFQTVPILLRASEVVPKDVLAGPNYTVKETVTNDGFVNMYELDTLYGPMEVESTALLLKRVAELRSLSKMEALKGTGVYLDALKNTAIAPLKTAVGLVTAPVGTVKGVASGIGNFFTKVGDGVASVDPHKDKLLPSVLGQSAFKREYAYAFDIDPYTTYGPLQKALTDVAWTSAAGGLTVQVAFMAIPGVGGAVVGLGGTVDTLKNMVRDKTPPELERINRVNLYDMDIVDPLASTFLSSPVYSPREKTFLVGALAGMTGVKDRGIFIETAVADCDESVALFIRVQAEMMGQYVEKAKNIDRFVNAGGIPVLLTKDGVIQGMFPLDHVAWTEGLEQKERVVSDAIQKLPGVKGKELWVTGTVDPVARKALEDRGWKVEEKVR
jgi:hypothetical protein